MLFFQVDHFQILRPWKNIYPQVPQALQLSGLIDTWAHAKGEIPFSDFILCQCEKEWDWFSADSLLLYTSSTSTFNQENIVVNAYLIIQTRRPPAFKMQTY